MIPATHQNCAASPPGKCGSGTFMPHIPLSTVSGRKMVDITVSTFITWLRRFEMLARFTSRMPVTRS